MKKLSAVLLLIVCSYTIAATYLTGDTIRSPDRTKTWTLPSATGTLLNTSSSSDIVSNSISSDNANSAAAGFLRMSSSEFIKWRNSGNTADNSIGQSSDELTYRQGAGGVNLLTYGGTPLFSTSQTVIRDGNDLTKTLALDISAITTGTNRTLTMPNASINLTTGLPVLYGGTGATTANAGFNALVPSQTSNSGKFLTTNGTDTSWATVDLTALIAKSTITAKGDIVVGTAAATPGVRSVGTDGYLLQADSADASGLSYIQATSTATASKVVKWDSSSQLQAVKVLTSAGNQSIEVDGRRLLSSGFAPLFDWSGAMGVAPLGIKIGNSNQTPQVQITMPTSGGSNHSVEWPGTNSAGIMSNNGSGTLSWTATPSLGTAGATAGTLSLSGATSGTVTIKTAAAAGTYNFILPTSMGSSGQVLTSDGTNSSWATPSSSTPAYAVTNKTTTYTATTSDEVITVDTSGGAWTLTLYTASGNTGRALRIKKTTSDANALTIDGNASETIDGATTLKIINQYEEVTIVSNGTNWIVTGRVNDLIKAFAVASSATSMINGAETIINFNSVTYDPLSTLTTGASWKFTAPVDGTYKICFNIMGVESTWPGANYSMYTRLFKNNSAHAYVTFVEVASTSSHSVTNNGCYSIKLVATDYIDLRANQNSGADRNTETAYSGLVWVSVEKIGAY